MLRELSLFRRRGTPGKEPTERTVKRTAGEHSSEEVGEIVCAAILLISRVDLAMKVIGSVAI